MADRQAMREQNRKDMMAEMERRHEELKLERRAIDRVTEDFRTKIKEEECAHEDKCSAAQAKISADRHKLKDLQDKCEELEAKNKTQATINAAQIKDIDADYDTRRIAKQKLQFKEHQTIKKKMEKEKKCHPNDVFALNIKALEEDVKECAVERDAVKKAYDDMLNEASNKLSKIKYQKNSQKLVLEEKERLLASLSQTHAELLQKHKDQVTGKSLLISRLKFDTARLEKSIPRLVDDLEKLDTYVLKFEMEEQNRQTHGPK